ncbi:type II toxin-antitoxin system VapC family toxin [Rhizobium sp. B230/85]|nr:type II toxin-antitoxin system VapC family toxin [Rhizobium sp. B209b/85]QXZ96526.1 type II toxin-antitoxin system VapC family toxin [Rhizobium sp. B230/85]
MMAFGTIYLDTNIFVIAFEAEDEISEKLSEIFGNIDSRPGARFATSELTLSELLVRPMRDNDPQAVLRYEALIRPSAWMEVIPVRRTVLTSAAFLRAHSTYLKLPDAIHVATAMEANCSHILTNDHGIQGQYALPGSENVLGQAAPLLDILRPDEPTLTSLLQSLAS